MPRKTPMPEVERQICARVRLFREKAKYPQASVARELGLTPTTLAMYESAKAPIRYELASKIVNRYSINQRWLATGILPETPAAEIPDDIEMQIPPRMLFSDAYARFIGAQIEWRLQIAANVLGCEPSKIDPDIAKLVFYAPPDEETIAAQTAQRSFLNATRNGFFSIPRSLHGPLLKALLDAFHAFRKKNAAKIRAFRLREDARRFPKNS